jgi:hypothetical protein
MQRGPLPCRLFFALPLACGIWAKYADFSENTGSRDQSPTDIESGVKFFDRATQGVLPWIRVT